ncbi:hypothetical protein JTE90_028575 [Oedothorax gibbosus]|uniref:RRM domain-containing protein n=1 Tax=Oedothorax gibbosus TaxID=931172 RepID=A0AAV6VUR9_9ARAC|nr:hypothetical protein JTE90_028575 [Oedothorax gibbosus]
MDSFDERNPENDGTSQFLQYLSLPAEPSDRDHPQKRTKLDNNLFERFTASPEYINIEPNAKYNSRKQEYSYLSLKRPYTNDVGKVYPRSSVRQKNFSSSVWDIVDPQGSVRGLAASPSVPKTSVFSTATASSFNEKPKNFSSPVWDIVDPQGSVRGLAASLSAPKTSVFSTACVSSTATSTHKTSVFSTATASSKATSAHKTLVFGTARVSSFKEKPTKCGKKLAPLVYCNCTLYPPADGIVPEPIMKRPLGCKTVIITGLPMSLGYDTLLKLFGYFGKIRHFSRQKRDNFSKVSFHCESSIDKVIEINGYTLVTSNGKETIKGTMTVNYASIRAERLEYDNQMKLQQTEKTGNELILSVPLCSEVNSPLELSEWTELSKLSPQLPQFSRHSIRNMIEEIQCDNLVNYSSSTLIRWMEEGKCKKYAEHFFDILCEMQSSVTRLMDDTAKLEESVWKHQGSLTAQQNSDSLYFAEILKVFNTATSKTVFNNSFKMKNQIEEWKRYIKYLYKSNSQEVSIFEVAKEKTFLPDSELLAQNLLVEQQKRELNDLKAENERLKKELRVAQREASKSYNDLIPWMSDETKMKYQQTKYIENDNHDESGIEFSEKEAYLIAMIGVFLSSHPSGKSTECICRYLFKIDPTVTCRNIHQAGQQVHLYLPDYNQE